MRSGQASKSAARSPVSSRSKEATARDRIRRTLEGDGCESVAICLLNRCTNPALKQRVAALVAGRFPGAGVTCSSDVTCEFREYERASTTALAACVQPGIDRYLKDFERALGARSFTGRFSLMQSNGGRLPASGLAGNATTALFSEPAAGVMGAIRQAERSGYRDLITFDMGGTSTDVCLVRDGAPVLTSDAEIDGLPIRTPVLDIVTVGAGATPCLTPACGATGQPACPLLDAGECEGPLLIGDETSTAYVPPGWRARIDAHHNAILVRRA